ncbi:MAG: CPBP family intramembrane metalloprotease [Chitinophagaceae bacterium]|nr:MAG: CPBP family intramembrane metalloprotease [Chitinophagaceae bacterium]
MYRQLRYYSMPIVKLVLFAIALIVFALPVGALQFIPAVDNLEDHYATILTEPLLMMSILGAMYVMTSMFVPSQLTDFFLSKRNFLKELLKGTLFGSIILSICAVIAWFAGFVSFSVGEINVGVFLLYSLYFLIVALFEELLFRTYALFVLAETYPIPVAVGINGLLFGLLHSFNPGFTILALVNITLAGILFSLFTLYYRSINWVVGIHLGWNFTQGILLGYKVSGTDMPGVLTAEPIGASYLSGGGFGIEASLICTLILTLIISYLAIKYKIKPVKRTEDYEFAGTR